MLILNTDCPLPSSDMRQALWTTESGGVNTSDDRWSALAAELDGIADAVEAAESDALVADLTRAEHTTISLADRLRAARGAGEVVVELLDGESLRGVVRHVAGTWFVIAAARRGTAEHLVPLTAVDGVTGLGRASAPARRSEPGMATPLRVLQRDRSAVLVRTLARRMHRGRIARVGTDHLDLDTVDGGRTARRVVPFAAILCVSHAPASLEF